MAGPALPCAARLVHAEELGENVQRIYRQFYSLRSMLRRLPLPTTQANIASHNDFGRRDRSPAAS